MLAWRPGMTKSSQGVFPMLSYEDGVAAIEWLTRVFGFRETPGTRIMMPDGSLGHVQMETGSGEIMLASGSVGYESPRHHREHCDRARKWSQVPWVINGTLVHVADAEAHYARAQREGATLLTDIEGGFPG